MKPWITTNTLVLLFFSSLTTVCHGSKDLFDEISTNNELQEFFNLCKNSATTTANWKETRMTVFAFSNAAYIRYTGTNRNSIDLCLYHMTQLYAPVAQFPASLPPLVVGNAPLWATKFLAPGTQGNVEFYINNALIMKRDQRLQTSSGQEQILHIIDEVLEPLIMPPLDLGALNPSAYKLMTDPQKYGVAGTIKEFKQRVDLMNRDVIFKGGDGSTFFIVSDGNVKPEIWNRMDARVIDAHVINEGVMFARPFPDEPQNTLAFADNLKVTISLKNESINSGRQFQLYAQSDNPLSTNTYPRGVVVSRIIQPNIPVKNGVVHIIDGPLVIINKNLLEFLQEKPSLSQFYDLIIQHGQQMLPFLSGSGDNTLFAPTNDAIKSIDTTRRVLVDSKPGVWTETLMLHLAQQRATTQSIPSSGVYVFPSSDGRRQLRMERTSSSTHYGSRDHKGVTVIGGGANATIIAADIAAINGILHIIDGVLGIPYKDIYEILKTEPQFSTTYKLGYQKQFNSQLTDLTKVFTYFVPNNNAWDKVRRNYEDEHRRLTSETDMYGTEKILERHLVVNHGYRLNELVKMRTIRTMNGEIEVTQDSSGRIVLQWGGVSAEIVVSDIEAKNGYVHAIGNVLMKRGDLTSGSPMPFTSLSFFSMVLPVFIVKLLA